MKKITLEKNNNKDVKSKNFTKKKFINSKKGVVFFKPQRLASSAAKPECFLGTLDYKSSSHPNFRIKIIEDHGYGFWCKDDSI